MTAITGSALVFRWRFCALPAAAQTAQQAQQAPVNPAIDMEGFLRVSQRAAKHRESRRLSEEEFPRMSREPGAVVLDARSRSASTSCTSRAR